MTSFALRPVRRRCRFDRVTIDQTGGLKPEFIPDSTIGNAGDKLHPNRAGYLAMGMVIDLDLFRPKQ